MQATRRNIQLELALEPAAKGEARSVRFGLPGDSPLAPAQSWLSPDGFVRRLKTLAELPRRP